MFQALRGELHKLFARKRTYMGFGVFVGIELLILFLLRLDRVQRNFAAIIERNGYVAEDYLSGLTLALMILLWASFLLGALYLALVAGDMVAKEVEDGTMRMILCRPVSRTRVIGIKFAALVIYTAVLTLFIAGSALVAGCLQAGTGGLFVFAPTEGIFALYSWEEGLWRFWLAVPLLALSMLTITSTGLFFSCFQVKPAAATIMTLSLFFVDSIMRSVPYFEGIRAWFITSKMGSWALVFEYRIPWDILLENYAILGAVNASLVLAGIAVFYSRDLKS